jgi:hypothetical protein
MPIAQLMVLGLIVSAFAIFIIVLLSASLYVAAERKEDAPVTSVTPARRPDAAAAANQTAARTPSDLRRFG